MNLLSFFNSRKAAPLFYSERAENARWQEDIRGKIKIPGETQAFTTGAIPAAADGMAQGTAIRFDARRIPGVNFWEIRKVTKFRLDDNQSAAQELDGNNGVQIIGEAVCDFDALRYLSEASAGLQHDAPDGHNDMPHWAALAAKAGQPVDRAGLIWPVADGKILSAPGGTMLFSNEQLAVMESSKPSAWRQAASVQRPAPSFLRRSFNKIVQRKTTDPKMAEALLSAAKNGELDAVKALLERHVDPDVQDEFGRTPLHLATSKGHPEIVQALLEHGADPDIRNKEGKTPLYEAAEHIAVILPSFRHADIAALLLVHGAKPNRKCKYGQSALHRAAHQGNTSTIRTLLEYGADPDLKNDFNETALHEAVFLKRIGAVQTLLENGANPHIRDCFGRTPLDKAKAFLSNANKNTMEIMGLLREAMHKNPQKKPFFSFFK